MGNYSVRACTDVIFDHALRQIYGGRDDVTSHCGYL